MLIPGPSQPWISHNIFQREQRRGTGGARRRAPALLAGQRVRKERRWKLPPEIDGRGAQSNNLSCWTRTGAPPRRPRRKRNDRPGRPQTRKVRDPPEAGPRRNGRRLPGAGYRAGGTGGAQADRAQPPMPTPATPSKPNAAAPNCRRAWPPSIRAWCASTTAGDLDGYLLRRHGIHRRAGSGGADAPRPAGRRVRRRCGHRGGRDARERPQPAASTIDGKEFHGIVHGDIKPKNIRIDARGEVRVLDFGIAKALSLSRRLTRNEFGSVPYASPERLESGEVNVRSDLWSLAVMLYEMVTGHAAVPGRHHRAAGAHDPLAHSAAARARSLPRAAAPHPDQGHGARSRKCATSPPALSPTTWRRSARGTPVLAMAEDLDATRRTFRRACGCGSRRDAPHRAYPAQAIRTEPNAADRAPHRAPRSARGRAAGSSSRGNAAPSASPCGSLCCLLLAGVLYAAGC